MCFRDEKGITGIDITVSIILITVFIAVVAALISNINQSSNEHDRQTQAISYAIDAIEDIKSKGYREDGSVNYNDKGIDSEYTLEDADIIENGEYTGFSKKILIEDYSHIKSEKTSNIVKKLTVEISYKFKGDLKSVVLSTYVAKVSGKDWIYMKSNKGITITSLIIYVIAMALIIVLLSRITTFFYKNVDTSALDESPTSQYTKFSNALTKETNISGNKVITVSNGTDDSGKQSNYIIFSDGNQYTYKEQNHSIYKNKIKICSNIDRCTFAYQYSNSQYVINVEFKSGNLDKTGNNKLSFTIQ